MKTEIQNSSYDKVTEWIRCPFCGNKTRLRIREDTELNNFPLYCPKCKQESLIKRLNNPLHQFLI